jgi:hypothetical protein
LSRALERKPETVMLKPNQRSREGEEVREDGLEERRREKAVVMMMTMMNKE